MTITINNQTFELTNEQVDKLKKALNLNDKQLSDVAIGDTFKVADIEFIKFAEEDGVVTAVAKDILFSEKFDGADNNFATSKLLAQLQYNVLPKIEAAVGADNVLEFETDLTSLDGLDDYGVMKSKISLPTFDFYRKNVKLFDKHKVKNWWWLSTPDSTTTHSWNTAVRIVDGDGALGNSRCNYSGGARPVCHFVSSIFIS